MAKPRGFSSAFNSAFGIGPYRYELVPWEWATSPFPHWRLPVFAVGGIDLRPLPAQALAGGAPQGFSFCACTQSCGGTEIATVGNMIEDSATTAMQDAWQTETGYRPQGAKIVDLLKDQLTTGSDPTGQSGPKPLVPTTSGFLEIHLGGHSVVWRERFTWGTHPHTNRLRDLLQRDFERQWEDSNGSDHCRRCLDYTCDKYKVKDWKEFVPVRLRTHVPGRLPHLTTITENFNTADSDTLGPNLTWTEFDTAGGDWDVVSNEARGVVSGGTSIGARADSDLSSDDHYAQVEIRNITLTATDSVARGLLVRKDSTATLTYYLMDCDDRSSGNDQWRTYKRVAGSFTALGTDTDLNAVVGDIVKGSADGSTIKRYRNGTEQNSTTDSAITGNLRCGLWGYIRVGETAPNIDNFEAADLAVAGMAGYVLGGGFLGGRVFG